MANFMSLEMAEHRYPIRFRQFAIREDSGGAGRFRGGCGTSYCFELLSDALVTVLGDRADHRPHGVAGGKPGAANRVSYRRRGRDIIPPLRSKYEKVPLGRGDLVFGNSPGGGGYGDPLDRRVEEVERDLNLGYVSQTSAERDYGVVVAAAEPVGEHTCFTLDAAATEVRRAELRGRPLTTSATAGENRP
jgi:N-methylhydantoinase B